MHAHSIAAFAALSTLIAGTSAASADPEVKLLHAQSITSSKYGLSSQQARFDIVVANLAYHKRVDVHLRRFDGQWIDVPASYVRSIAGNREVWRATYAAGSSQGTPTHDLRFAVRYQVGGGEHWDNNAGQDYSLGADAGSIMPEANVLATTYEPEARIWAGDNRLYGRVTLRNLAFAKDVTIVYTTDGWATVRTAAAAYYPYIWSGAYSSAPNPNAYGFEEWSFNLDCGSAATVTYAISYTVGGQTYWDNNFGQDYTTRLTRY